MAMWGQNTLSLHIDTSIYTLVLVPTSPPKQDSVVLHPKTCSLGLLLLPWWAGSTHRGHREKEQYDAHCRWQWCLPLDHMAPSCGYPVKGCIFPEWMHHVNLADTKVESVSLGFWTWQTHVAVMTCTLQLPLDCLILHLICTSYSLNPKCHPKTMP